MMKHGAFTINEYDVSMEKWGIHHDLLRKTVEKPGKNGGGVTMILDDLRLDTCGTYLDLM